MKLDVFGSAKEKQAVKSYLPAMWWSIIGREAAPNLTHLAMRILSQTVSSSNCERNWTTFAMIHTKLRNRIKMENLEKLVFVHYNMRLRVRHAKRQQTTDQLIDLDYIFHEEDPLAEWTREAENPLLDNASDNPWSDNDNVSAENTENDRSSNDDSGNAGGDGIGSSGYGVGSTFDESQRHIQNYEADDYSRRRVRCT